MKTLIDLLHLLLCQKHHESDMLKLHSSSDPDICYYYLECDIAGGESMESHLTWINTTEQFKVAMGFTSDKVALEFVKSAISISQDVRTLAGDNKLKIDFIMSLLI